MKIYLYFQGKLNKPTIIEKANFQTFSEKMCQFFGDSDFAGWKITDDYDRIIRQAWRY